MSRQDWEEDKEKQRYLPLDTLEEEKTEALHKGYLIGGGTVGALWLLYYLLSA